MAAIRSFSLRIFSCNSGDKIGGLARLCNSSHLANVARRETTSSFAGRQVTVGSREVSAHEIIVETTNCTRSGHSTFVRWKTAGRNETPVMPDLVISSASDGGMKN